MPPKGQVKTKETEAVRTVKRNDAMLALAALDLAHSFVHAQYDPTQPGGLAAQKDAVKGNYQMVFDALEDHATTKQLGVIETIWTAAQQGRALLDAESAKPKKKGK